MFDAYPDDEFRNLTRSTLPLLAYWRNQAAALAGIGSALGLSDLGSACVTPEFPTPSAGPHNKASFTDVMIESHDAKIAVEGKWTEPRYETVSVWLQAGRNPANRKDVLAHWAALIRRKANRLDEGALAEIPYQMIHRTASACAFTTKRSVVLYEVFRDGTHDVNYAGDLSALAKALGAGKELQLWLQEIPLTLTNDYGLVEKQIHQARSEEIPLLVRRAL